MYNILYTNERRKKQKTKRKTNEREEIKNIKKQYVTRLVDAALFMSWQRHQREGENYYNIFGRIIFCVYDKIMACACVIINVRRIIILL